MIKMILSLSIGFAFIYSHSSEHEHPEEEKVEQGPAKAIVSADSKQGLQLSEKAVKTLGLNYLTITGESPFKVPTKSLVFFQEKLGVYRFRNGWHKLLEVTPVSQKPEETLIKSSELKSGDQIVKKGAPLLRVAELEAWGGSGDGHGH